MDEPIELKWYEKKQGMTVDSKRKAAERKEAKHLKRKVEQGKAGDDAKARFELKQEKKSARKEAAKSSVENKQDKGPKNAYQILNRTGLFNPNSVPQDAQEVINDFSSVLQHVNPINSKQRAQLPEQIRQLSHYLTDERGSRRLGYMNEKTLVTAYTNYFLWWNLVRLVKLFANLPSEFKKIKDNSVCIDLGSGPLTVVTALFLACPELRKIPLTWYCLDLSSQSLSMGENIYYAVCARLKCEPWKIVRVKGEIGTEIRQKCSLITSANVFNELNEDSKMPPEYYAKKYTDKIMSYINTAEEKTKILLVEPGTPKAARLVSNMRDAFIRKKFYPVAPCSHINECPMNGSRGGKWCNLSFSTDDAPAELKKLSEKSLLPKERAVLSFVAVVKHSYVDDLEKLAENMGEVKTKFQLTIASDPIRLPGDRTGYYACSPRGLILAVSQTKLFSGEILTIKEPKGGLKIDAKSGAEIINLG